MAPPLRATTMALRIGRAIPANEPMSNTMAVSNLLCTNPNALPVAGSAQPRVPPRPIWPNPFSSRGIGAGTAAGLLLLLPFCALHRGCVLAQKNPDLLLLRDRHG